MQWRNRQAVCPLFLTLEGRVVWPILWWVVLTWLSPHEAPHGTFNKICD